MLDPILSLGGASYPPWGREVTRRIRHKRLMHEMIYDLSEDQVQFRDVNETFLRKSYGDDARREIGRAHVCTPVTNAHLVCSHLLETKNRTQMIYSTTLQHT